MTEYIVDGAQPNSTVLKSVTRNGYEHEMWLPVREEVVRCRDCRYHVSVTDGDVCRKPCGDEAAGRVWVEPDGFCAWGKPRSK